VFWQKVGDWNIELLDDAEKIELLWRSSDACVDGEAGDKSWELCLFNWPVVKSSPSNNLKLLVTGSSSIMSRRLLSI
jgi:hypothetical protein